MSRFPRPLTTIWRSAVPLAVAAILLAGFAQPAGAAPPVTAPDSTGIAGEGPGAETGLAVLRPRTGAVRVRQRRGPDGLRPAPRRHHHDRPDPAAGHRSRPTDRHAVRQSRWSGWLGGGLRPAGRAGRSPPTSGLGSTCWASTPAAWSAPTPPPASRPLSKRRPFDSDSAVPGDPCRGAPLHHRGADSWARPAPPPRRAGSGTSPPPTWPGTWTCCGRRSAIGGCPTWGCRTGPTSARRTRGSSPIGSGPWLLDGTIDPREYAGTKDRGLPVGARIDQGQAGAEVFAEFLRAARRPARPAARWPRWATRRPWRGRRSTGSRRRP